MCEVMGTGLAFQELGKSGYKIYFGLDEFEEELTDDAIEQDFIEAYEKGEIE